MMASVPTENVKSVIMVLGRLVRYARFHPGRVIDWSAQWPALLRLDGSSRAKGGRDSSNTRPASEVSLAVHSVSLPTTPSSEEDGGADALEFPYVVLQESDSDAEPRARIRTLVNL